MLEKSARLCMALGTDGLRGELTLMRAARALAAYQGHAEAGDAHLRRVAGPALRHRCGATRWTTPVRACASSGRCRSCSAREARGCPGRPRGRPCLACRRPAGRAHRRLGGIHWRGLGGVLPEAWLDRLRRGLPAGAALRRLPLNIDDERLLGGLDLAATLASGRPVRLPGLLAQTDRGVLLLPMAERLSAQRSAQLAAVLDRGEVEASRSADGQVAAARVALVALDDGQAEGEALPLPLSDRLALHLSGWLRTPEPPDPDWAAARDAAGRRAGRRRRADGAGAGGAGAGHRVAACAAAGAAPGACRRRAGRPRAGRRK
jgi:hypothetical protein